MFLTESPRAFRPKDGLKGLEGTCAAGASGAFGDQVSSNVACRAVKRTACAWGVTLFAMRGHRPATTFDATAWDQQHAKLQLPVDGCVENGMPFAQLPSQFRARVHLIRATTTGDAIVFHAAFEVAVDLVMAVAKKTGIELMEACGRESSVPL